MQRNYPKSKWKKTVDPNVQSLTVPSKPQIEYHLSVKRQPQRPMPNIYSISPLLPLYHVQRGPHRRTYTSTHGKRHSRLPKRLRSHSTPIPVHSVFVANCRFASSSAVPARAKAVLFNAPAYIPT